MAIFAKTWLAFWTNNGIPATGLSASIQIRRVDTGAIVQASTAMTEIGDGWYKFVQASFDDSLQYVARMDGSSSVTPQERYQSAAAPAEGEDRTTIANSVDAELTAQHGSGSWVSATTVIVAKTSTVAAGSTSVEIRTGLAESDGYWVNMVMIIDDVSGSGNRVARNIDRYTQLNGSLYTFEGLPFTPTPGDPVYILAMTGSLRDDRSPVSF